MVVRAGCGFGMGDLYDAVRPIKKPGGRRYAQTIQLTPKAASARWQMIWRTLREKTKVSDRK
jgi:hypothetical protein